MNDIAREPVVRLYADASWFQKGKLSWAYILITKDFIIREAKVCKCNINTAENFAINKGFKYYRKDTGIYRQ
jgi:hypothetical protein